MDLLERAQKSLNQSIVSTKAVSAQSHALDSIAASLLFIAKNINQNPTVDDNHIELVVRRLLDGIKEPTAKKGKTS